MTTEKQLPLKTELIQDHVEAWIGTLVNQQDHPSMTATIESVRDEKVFLKLPGGKLQSVPFQEIVDAATVLRDCSDKSKSPKKADFRNPDPTIGVQRINNDSYAPAIAKRILRSIGTAVGGPTSREFNVVIESDEEGYYIASVPALHGCHTQAKSLDELMERVRETILLCVEVKAEAADELEFVGIQRVSVPA